MSTDNTFWPDAASASYPIKFWQGFYFALSCSYPEVPELMINAGWTAEETVNQYKPRFLHALNALSDCKLDKPVTIPEVVDMMDKPATFNPTGYRTIRDTEADTILSKLISILIGENYIAKHGDSLFATKGGIEKRLATDPYWKRTSSEIYYCD